MNDPRIRLATPMDARGIAAVHVRTWQSAYKGLIPDSILKALNVDERATQWLRNLENQRPPNRTMVAEIENVIVGFVGFGPHREIAGEKVGEVYAIYVMPNKQEQGVGKALMNEALKSFKNLDFTNARLWVLETNLSTRSWYEALGWEVTGNRKSENRDHFTLNEVEYRLNFAG